MSTDRTADETTIERVLAGDTEAFGDLVARHGRRVHAAVLRMVRDADAAEDLAQEAFVKAYTGLASFRRGSSFYTWLYSIAVNQVRSEFRRRGARGGGRTASLDAPGRDGASLPEPAARGPGPADEAARRDDAALLHEAIDGLDEEFRVAVVLRDLQGLSYEEISVATGAPVGTVRSRIHRARASLRETLLASRRVPGGR